MLSTFGRVVFVVLMLGSIAFFTNEVWVRYAIIKKGKKDVKRWDHPFQRMIAMLVRVFSQTCAIKDRTLVGVMHAMIFWGFVFFAGATINHIGSAFHEGFSLFGRGTLNNLWFLGVEIVGVFTMIGTIYMAIRRYILKPEGIKKPMPISSSPQSAIVLLLIFILMVTYFLNRGVELMISGEKFAAWIPVSTFCSGFFENSSLATLHILNQILWWIHILSIFTFLFFIPHSKHFHLLAGPINIFFQSDENIPPVEKIDFEASEEYGVTKVTDYQWKTLLDGFSCIECGRCQDQCPAYKTGKPLSPKVIMMQIRKHMLSERKNLVAGNDTSELLMDDHITPDEIWACTTCGACMETCPVMNEHIPAIIGLRQSKVMMDSKFPQELSLAFKGLETNGNPWNMGAASRADWMEGLNVPTIADRPEVDYLWFVGCAGAYDDAAKATSQAFAKILNKAGISYAVLGTDEQCCGDPARRSGNEYVFQMLAQANIDAFKSVEFKKIVTACPHCFHIIKNEYPQFDGDFEVIHHTELIAELIASGKLNINQNGLPAAAFHDSCYLGRYHGIYDAPRDILKTMSDDVKELDRHHEKSYCCGGGGARFFMEESGERINHERIQEVADAGIKMLGVACPFCQTMLQDAVKDKALEESLEVKDLAQLVAERI